MKFKFNSHCIFTQTIKTFYVRINFSEFGLKVFKKIFGRYFDLNKSIYEFILAEVGI